MIFDSITIHDLTKPVRARLEDRATCGPATWTPARPGTGRGFYTSCRGALKMHEHESPIRLRLESTDEHVPSRLRGTYYIGDDLGESGVSDFHPVIARLPHRRGFLAGWVMGAGMCGVVDGEIHATPEDAARAAHSMAERDAEAEREYQARERARIEEEEAAERAHEDHVAGIGTDE